MPQKNRSNVYDKIIKKNQKLFFCLGTNLKKLKKLMLLGTSMKDLLKIFVS